MNRFYCPFCSSRYQFQKTRDDGILICGQCGDPLVKKPYLNSRGILGIVVSTAFFSPLLMLIVFAINDFTKEKPPKNSESLVLLNIDKNGKYKS